MIGRAWRSPCLTCSLCLSSPPACLLVFPSLVFSGREPLRGSRAVAPSSPLRRAAPPPLLPRGSFPGCVWEMIKDAGRDRVCCGRMKEEGGEEKPRRLPRGGALCLGECLLRARACRSLLYSVCQGRRDGRGRRVRECLRVCAVGVLLGWRTRYPSRDSGFPPRCFLAFPPSRDRSAGIPRPRARRRPAKSP